MRYESSLLHGVSQRLHVGDIERDRRLYRGRDASPIDPSLPIRSWRKSGSVPSVGDAELLLVVSRVEHVQREAAASPVPGRLAEGKRVHLHVFLLKLEVVRFENLPRHMADPLAVALDQHRFAEVLDELLSNAFDRSVTKIGRGDHAI